LSARQQERRDRIVRAALLLLENRGHDAIQMRDVAAEASVALGTVYRYFSSKDHLFQAVLLQWAESLRRNVDHHPLPATDPREGLRDLALRVLRAFERRPQFLPLILNPTDDPQALALHIEFNAHTGDTFMAPLVDLDPDLALDIMYTIKAVTIGALRQWSHREITMAEARRRVIAAVDLVFGAGQNVSRSKGKVAGQWASR
jgi:TetR/AcrR family transcriptional regulator, cholesterol catabolism regulator